MTDIKSMTLEEITQACREMGEPAFRGKQIFTWLHKGVTSFDGMSNLSKAFREKRAAQYTSTAPVVARKQMSKLDGTMFKFDGTVSKFDGTMSKFDGTFRQKTFRQI